MCGEKEYPALRAASVAGSPPRVRGKANGIIQNLPALGITPACAGKRNCCCHRAGTLRDHPRVCGEKQTPRLSQSTAQGSPPRVRGKVYKCVQAHTSQGITPACAGKSKRGKPRFQRSEDHPRVCGEKGGLVEDTETGTGSPPRVRGKGHAWRQHSLSPGITPACAGKSNRAWSF